MKTLFTLFTILMVNQLSSQSVKKTILQNNIGSINCHYSIKIDSNRGDTVYNVSISFQNEENERVKDIQSIDLKNKSLFNDFKNDLTKSIPVMGTRKPITYEKDNWSIYLYDYSDKMFLQLPVRKGTGYTTVLVDDVKSLLNWLESIQFGKN